MNDRSKKRLPKVCSCILGHYMQMTNTWNDAKTETGREMVAIWVTLDSNLATADEY